MPTTSPRHLPAVAALALVALLGCGSNQLLARGDEAMSRGEYSQAIDAYDEAARRSANDPVEGPAARERLANARRDAARASLSQGDAAFEAHRLETAAEHYRRARAYAPTDPQVIAAQARLLSLRTDIEGKIERLRGEISALTAAGDGADLAAFRKAASGVRSLRPWRADYPAIDSLWERARRGVAGRLMAEARRLEAARDVAGALAAVDEALRYDATIAGGVELRDAQRARGDVDRLVAEGNDALERGDLQAAVDAFGRAVAEAPEHEAARAGHAKARDAWVAAHLDAAKSAAKARKRKDALLLLRQAAEVGAADSKLAASLDKALGAAERAAASHFEREALRLERKKLFGAALLAWRTAAAVGSARRDLGQRIEAGTRRVEAERAYRLALDPVRVAKEHRETLAAPLMAALQARAAGPTLGDAGVQLVEGRQARGASGHLVLDVARFAIVRVDRPEERHKKILDHVAFPPNPAWDQAQARQSTALTRLNQASDRLRPIEQRANDIETRIAQYDAKLAEIRRQIDSEDAAYYRDKKPPCADGSTRCPESYGHRRWAQQIAYYETKIRDASAQLAGLAPALGEARDAVAAAQRDFDDAERAGRETPKTLRNEVWKDYPYTVMAHEVRYEVDASLEWKDRTTGKSLALETVRIEDKLIDFSTPEIVVKDQLVEPRSESAHPDDASLRAQLIARSLDALTAKVFVTLAAHGQRFVLRTEVAKRPDERLHWQVLALGAGAGLDDTTRARLEQAVLDATGYDWQRIAVDLSRIPY